MTPELAARTYALPASDPVRAKLESPFFGRLLPRLLHEAGGGRVLDLGCGRRAPSWATALLPGLPPLREAIGRLLGGDESSTPLEALTAPLPPLPAGPAARVHHALADRRREFVPHLRGGPACLARAAWGLEGRSGGGFGHGLTMVARVP